MTEIISSKDNPKIKLAVKLKNSAKSRREAGLFVAEGLRLVGDAVKNQTTLNTVFYTEEIFEKHKDSIKTIIENSNSAYSVTAEVMQKLSDTVTPQGVVALCEIPQMPQVSLSAKLYVCLENTADPANLGAIARSAEAFGADGIIISSGSCDPYAPKALRAGMGALLRLPIIICGNFCDTLTSLQKQGAKVYASVVQSSAESIKTVCKSGCKLLVIGNEANGISQELEKVADYSVTIPMAGRAESLNASAAASVLIWEMLREGGK